jgi:hypothetical protein
MLYLFTIKMGGILLQPDKAKGIKLYSRFTMCNSMQIFDYCIDSYLFKLLKEFSTINVKILLLYPE